MQSNLAGGGPDRPTTDIDTAGIADAAPKQAPAGTAPPAADARALL